MIYAMSGETKGLPKLLHILSEVVNRPVFSPEEVSATVCFGGETIGDKNISILHLSCRTNDIQFSLVLQTLKIVCAKEHKGVI